MIFQQATKLREKKDELAKHLLDTIPITGDVLSSQTRSLGSVWQPKFKLPPGMFRCKTLCVLELNNYHLQDASSFDGLILRCFEVLSGLKINFHKSLLCGVGLSDDEVNQFTSIFNCRSHKHPFSYLGLPLEANPSRKSTWQPVIEKVKRKLATWKRKVLSYAGRLTLIRSVLSCMPIYFLSIFKIPVGVAKQIEKIQAAFLCGKSELKRKVHLVKWADLTVDKSQGGLGLRNLREFNACLLLKWWWRFGMEGRAIWKQMLWCKYGLAGYLPFQSLEMGKDFFFWEDKWLNNICLKVEFPRLYRLSEEKGCTILQMNHSRGSTLEWKFLFSRSLYAWEEEEVVRLQGVLRDTHVLTDQAEDSCLWMANPSGSYSVGVSWK
ncbi:unnamed protein product [Camellia sinensis]